MSCSVSGPGAAFASATGIPRVRAPPSLAVPTKPVLCCVSNHFLLSLSQSDLLSIMSGTPYQNVLVVGATGHIGSHFVDAFLESPLKFNVNILVRQQTHAVRTLRPSRFPTQPPHLLALTVAFGCAQDEKKKAQIDSFVAKGAKLAYGDVNDPASLVAPLKGIDLVVSALGGESLHGSSGESNLVHAAKSAGVKRFVPSQFGVDIHDLTVGAVPFLDTKVKTLLELQKVGLDYIIVSTNVWTDYVLGMNFFGWNIFEGSEGMLPNDGNEFVSSTLFLANLPYAPFAFVSLVSFTTLHDVPYLAIPALVDPALKNAHVRIAADTLTWNQVADAVDQTLNKKITRKYFNTQQIDDLMAGITNPLGKFGYWLLRQYQVDPERVNLGKRAYNIQHPEKYSHFKATSVLSWLQQAAAQKK